MRRVEDLITKKKRTRSETEEANGIGVEIVSGKEFEELPGDTESVLSSLKQDCFVVANSVPFVIDHQIYSFISNRSQVDIDLEAMVRTNKIRKVFIKSGGEGLNLLVYSSDLSVLIYKQLSNNLYTLEKESKTTTQEEEKIFQKKKTELRSVADLFKNVLMPAHTGIWTDLNLFKETIKKNSKISPDFVVSTLQSWGFLSTRVELTETKRPKCHFCIPNIGRSVKMTIEGNEEVVKIIKRKKHKEVMEQQLMTNQLTRSTFGIKFHLYCLLGSDIIQKIESPAGNCYKLK